MQAWLLTALSLLAACGRVEGPVNADGTAGALRRVGARSVGDGIVDRVSPDPPGPVALNLPLTGTYVMFPDDRGEMTWWVSGGVVAFGLALTADGESGYFQTFYNSAVRANCEMHKRAHHD